MITKVKVAKRYEPEISLDQILAFEIGKPETYTPSKLVNAVCELLSDKQFLCGKIVGERLGINSKELSCALKIITGMCTQEIRAELIARRIRQLRNDYPDAKTDELAKAVGFSDYSTLWRFVERNKKRFPELAHDEAATKERIKVLVKKFMGHEDIIVQRLYIELPFKGGKEEEEVCFKLLYKHARRVADLSMEINRRHPEMEMNEAFIEKCALLHNVGIVLTDTPGLHCHGKEPYVKHGVAGADWMIKHRKNPFSRPARLHLGSGLHVIGRKIGQVDLVSMLEPLTDYDKLICYASCFYSIFDPDHRKSLDEIRENLAQYGEGAVQRFDDLHQMFE